MNVKCDVYRFDPDRDTEGRHETYVLDAEPTETVLDMLIRIYRDLQPSLSFRFACGVVKCGECAVTVNGTPCLACERVIEPEIKIDPLPGLPLIKDLVIDRRKAFEHIFKLLPELSRRLQIHERWQSIEPETADRYVQLTRCFECLMCQSACPVFADDAGEICRAIGTALACSDVAGSRERSYCPAARRPGIGPVCKVRHLLGRLSVFREDSGSCPGYFGKRRKQS